ncbi:hypothetical protein PCC9214_01564 [Planktothrix tepida]|uniref:Uncharacterized protein n=2 Tax=Planktothrix TaxID=54304 RepID=A0A1J1LIK7_9CYAN|nr:MULTISPECIES: hypothetical protein [Planktothrix]CAD5935351.1 hypothetical protein PCC9214_01564 [Planktothrix tepida]CAD5976171.1 hypothetical protein NO713_04184 [Planktothrix pseudagardhii]CUR31850.1 conserved hypothetical protein [Planktothrix tepida PCC 9214]
MAKMKGKDPKKGKRIAPPPPLPSTPNYDLEPPVFCLRYLDKTHGLDSCDQDEKAALVSTFYKLSQLSWRELRRAPRHGLGYEIIDRKSFRVTIPKHITEDVNLIAFRFSGLKPMVGYRDEAIFRIIWLDKSFKVYDHGS